MSKLKAVAYARFSSDRQRVESIDAQLRAIHKFPCVFAFKHSLLTYSSLCLLLFSITKTFTKFTSKEA